MKIGINLGGSHLVLRLVKRLDQIIFQKKEKDIVEEDKEKIKDIIEQTFENLFMNY